MAGARRAVAAAAAAAAIAALASCGGPLDRRDGALLIRLRSTPPAADAAAIDVRTAARTFSATVTPLPADGVIRVFSAVSAGRAEIDVRLLAGGAVIASELALSVEIIEDREVVVDADFGGGPEVVIDDPAEGAHHRVFEGPIPLTVRALDPNLEIDLVARANGATVPVLSAESLIWVGSIDPRLAGPVLPASLSIEVEACPRAGGPCRAIERTIEVHRRLFPPVALGGVSARRPAFDPASESAVLGDESGLLRAIPIAASGDSVTPLFTPIQLVAPLSLGVAIAPPGHAIVIDGGGTAHAIALPSGAAAPWRVELGPARPTGAAAARERVYVGAGRSLVEIDPSNGATRTLHELSSTIRADPLADARGVVAVDLLGEAVALDASGAVEWTASVGAAVLAAPVRDGGDTVLVTAEGAVYRVHGDGGVEAPIRLEAPVAHAPVALSGGGLAVAAGDRLHFVGASGGASSSVPAVRLGAAITGAPAAWPDGRRVIVGLRDGRAVVVGAAATEAPRVLSRVGGAALPPLVLPGRTAGEVRVLIAGTAGHLEMLLAEEGF